MAWFDSLLLRCSSPRIRCKAVENLSGSSRPSDTELLCASLHDKDSQVRCAAVRALAKANRPDSLRLLVGALKDPGFEVREAAARALGRLGSLGSAPALAACLTDPDAAVRIAAAAALRSMGWKPSTREELAWFEIALGNTPAPAAVVSVPASDDTVPNQDTTFFRRMAAEALKERTDPRRIKSLVADLRGSDLLARVSAVHDLGQFSDPQITQLLLALFRDREPQVRLAAAQALSKRSDAPPAHFVGLLQDTSAEVRTAAVQFLGRIRHEQIAQVLFPLLADPSLHVRQAAAVALGRIGSPSAIEALVVSLADPDDQMRETVQRALERTDPQWVYSDAAVSARGRLEALLDASPPSHGFLIREILEQLPPPQSNYSDGAQPLHY